MSREVYEPAEDTQLVLDALAPLLLEGMRVLDVGTGSGALAAAAQAKGARVTAVDLNPHACDAARARIGGRVVRGDLMSALRGPFDLVLFNAPYLPSADDERVEGWLDHAFHGGEGGIETSLRFVRDLPRVLAPGGKAFLVVSSRADLDTLAQSIAKTGLRLEPGPSKRFFFEEVAVWALTRQP